MRISGVTVTEYAAQVAASPTASRSPPRSAETLPPLPSATSETPPKVTAAAAQKRGEGRSRPTAAEINPVKIGVVPRISATVVALASLSE